MATDTELVDVELNDAELFSGATADEHPTEQPAEQPAPERPRDEHGRFAPKEPEKPAEEPPASEAPVETKPVAGIPPARLKEEADKRREFESLLQQERQERERLARELAEMRGRMSALDKPKAAQEEPEVDPLIDPQGFVKRIKGEFENERLNDRREFSLRLAKAVHREKFDEAYSAAQQAMQSGDRQLMLEMQASADPGETLMAWHKKQSTLRMVGDDPNAWLEKQIEARLADQAFQAKFLERIRGAAQPQPGSRQAPNVQLPPSLSNMARGGEKAASSDDNDTSDEALFSYATRR